MALQTISVILPVYNEAKVLERNVRRLESILKSLPSDYEIIISEDGSTDGTPRIAKSLESGRIRVMHNGRRSGKGAAIRSAAGHARGNIVIFMDADLASNPEQIGSLVGKLRDGAAIVVGSRYLPGSKAKRSLTRYVASRSFNWLVSMLLGSRLSDHQCGFKAFRKDVAMPLVEDVGDRRWFWDTELLVRAQRMGLRVGEIPVEWKESEDSKFNLMKDTLHMAWSLLLFKIRRG